MSTERLGAPSQETKDSTRQLELTAESRLEELRQQAETGQEADRPDQRAEQAREVINKQEKTPEPPPAPETTPTPIPKLPAFNPRDNYAETLASMQHKLRPLSRSFSKVIHAPIVEKTSEILEKSIARPSVTVGATWTALVVGAVFYFTARTFGYALSGSEMLLSFIAGGIVGVLLEGVWRLIRR